MIVEQVPGQFFIEGKLLDTPPASVGILRKKFNSTQNKTICIDNLTSDKIVCLDLYQLHSLHSDHHPFISDMSVA